MRINESKTKFVIINGTDEERQPLIHEDLKMKNCDTLGWCSARMEKSSPPSKWAHLQQEREDLYTRVRNSGRTKYVTYRTLINPDMKVHGMYLNSEVSEHGRLVATKYRLSSQNLGRWRSNTL